VFSVFWIWKRKELSSIKTKMADPSIIVEQLRVIYNQGKSNEVRSLDGVSVQIYPQEYVIIFGPSGCGKSTLLYGISGLQAPTYGEVSVNGKNLAKMTKRETVDFHQSSIGMVFQAFYLIPTLTVWDNVCLPKVFRGEELKERKEESLKLLRRFGIAEQADKFPSQLSGGQKQRVAIARALVNNPQIILADEPVGNLDSESAENVLEILRELNEVDKKTVIMVTHNAEHLHYADRIIYMKDGKVLTEEVIREKRPAKAIEEDVVASPEMISNELKILSRTFKNLSLQQVGVLLIPFKAKQLLTHLLSDLMEEQVSSAEAFLKELLFKNINLETLGVKLDQDLDKGGAGWNKRRADHFAARVQQITAQADSIQNPSEESIMGFSNYLIGLFDLKLDQEQVIRLRSFVKLRIQNRIDRFGLNQRLDTSVALGGVGLYKGTAERVVREIEMVMLLKYSA
jgi:putative ABC transport system ATP-binding protein